MKELAEKIYKYVNSIQSQRGRESWDEWDDKREVDFIRSLINNNCTSSPTEISDDEIEKAFIDASERLSEYKEGLIDGAKWYREQLKSKGNENKSNSSI